MPITIKFNNENCYVYYLENKQENMMFQNYRHLFCLIKISNNFEQLVFVMCTENCISVHCDIIKRELEIRSFRSNVF